MCISCFFTIFLYIMPACLVFFFGDIKDSAMNDFVNWYAIISGDMNSVVNVLIIYWKQTDIADAIRRTLRPLINIQQHHLTAQTAIALCSKPRQVAVVGNNSFECNLLCKLHDDDDDINRKLIGHRLERAELLFEPPVSADLITKTQLLLVTRGSTRAHKQRTLETNDERRNRR
uniref:Uncharacterized protein n=1 Tax=Parascaris equorum TaxID=6256 RepID=A0A914S7K2_PAREQ